MNNMSLDIMNKIIPLDETYEFVFVEDGVNIQHPVSNYYMRLNDLSINLVINFKWIKWGYYFLTSIKEELDVLGSEYDVKSLLSNTIQDFGDMKENEKIISIDDVIIKNNLEFIGFIKKQIDGDLVEFFNENTKIHMKMKINLREYLIMTNVLYPTLVKWEEIVYFDK
jgi:hypothetical protein